VVINWISGDGTVLGTLKDTTPVDVLTTPLRVAAIDNPEPSFVIKRNVDGLLYETIPPTETETETSVPKWTHSSTFSALAFVLASKRDTRFSFHLSNRAVLAFESGGSGNLFIYKQTVQVRDPWAKQSIMKVSGGASGNLLGAGAIIKNGNGEVIVLCLCENELKVLRNIIS